MAGLIAPAVLEQIRSASDIVDIIGAALPLKRAGANWVTLCPFHKEKSPSFNVNPSRQIFHCFGCHKGGDVFRFIQEYENIGFLDSVKRLAERANIPLEFDTQPGQQQARQSKDTLLKLHEDITKRWQSALANEASGQIARDYLEKRGVSAEAIQVFRLGYAPEVWDDTVNWSKGKGYDLDTVEKGGLVLKKEETGRYYDRFRGRLMFPICDEQGRVVGFSGRILSGDEKTAKYVNSPETPIFTKGKVFFGLDKSKRAILDAGFAIVCEGQLDLIACYMAGVQNIVAPQGTALTGDHTRILKRYVEEVVLCFDSDSAGQNAAVRSLDPLLASGLAIRVATVPPPHDPDSFIKEQGGEAFRELINKAEGYFDFYLNRLCTVNDVNTDRGRKAVVADMREAVWKANDVVLLDACAQKAARRLGVATEAVRAEFKKGGGPKHEEPVETALPPEEEVALPSPHEMALLGIALKDDLILDWLATHLEPEWCPHPVVREILTRRLTAHVEQTWVGAAAFVGEFPDDLSRRLITQALAEEQAPGRDLRGPYEKRLRWTLYDTVTELRQNYIEGQIAELERRRRQSGAQDPETLREQLDWRARKKIPLPAIPEHEEQVSTPAESAPAESEEAPPVLEEGADFPPED